MTAEDLARAMEEAVDEALCRIDALRPYAVALLQAKEALTRIEAETEGVPEQNCEMAHRVADVAIAAIGLLTAEEPYSKLDALDIAALTQEEREAVADWAGAIHLRASDNPGVCIPPRPACNRTFWLGVAMFIAGYACGAVRENWLNARDLNYALRQSASCADSLDRAVSTLETVEPILRAVWPEESKWWFAHEVSR